MSRKSAREIAMQVVFSRTLGGDATYESILAFAEKTKRPSAKDKQFVKLLVEGTWEHIADIDAAIEANSIDWHVSNMPAADLCILRICVFELLYNAISENICINEAVELAKKFGGDKSAPFINGVLGSVVKNKHNYTQPDISTNLSEISACDQPEDGETDSVDAHAGDS